MTIAPMFLSTDEVRRQPRLFGEPLVDVRPTAPGQWVGWYRGTDARPIIYDPRLWAPVERHGMRVDLRPRGRLGDDPSAAEQPIAPWFVWAMLFGVGSVFVYAMLPPDPPPRAREPRRRVRPNRRTSRGRRRRTSRRRATARNPWGWKEGRNEVFTRRVRGRAGGWGPGTLSIAPYGDGYERWNLVYFADSGQQLEAPGGLLPDDLYQVMAVADRWARDGFRHAIPIGAMRANAAPKTKAQIEKRLDAINRESDRLAKELRELIWADKPDAYFDDWSHDEQDAYDAKQDEKRQAIKDRRDELEEESIELDHALHRLKRTRRNPDAADPEAMTEKAIRAELDALKNTIDKAYWTYTRTARGKPPILTVPDAYQRRRVLEDELRRRRGIPRRNPRKTAKKKTSKKRTSRTRRVRPVKAKTAIKMYEAVGIVREIAPRTTHMPPGAIGTIKKRGAGTYVVGYGRKGQSIRKFQASTDLTGVLASARMASRASGEPHWVVDYHGGYPVVVRQMDGRGRTVYRAEEYALELLGRELELVQAKPRARGRTRAA